MQDLARRAARVYRARAERCYRLAREAPDFLGTEIMTSCSKKREGWSGTRASGAGESPKPPERHRFGGSGGEAGRRTGPAEIGRTSKKGLAWGPC
jgi:hypothetical protein